MKIKCDSCGAIYNISEDKLTKDVSKATCKKCGSKIIIRRQGNAAESLDDLRAGRAGEEDNVINHEERTVIAQVPELNNGELPMGATSSEDVARSFAAEPATPVVPEPARKVAPPVTSPSADKVPGAAKAGDGIERPAAGGVSTVSAGMQQAPLPTMPVTVDTSPARPSGASSLPPPPPSQIQPPVAPAPQKRPNVADIFGNQESKPTDDEFGQLTRLPLVLLGIAFLGVLTFVHNDLWRVSLLTQAGFVLALYAIGVSTMTYADLLRGTGRIRYVRVLAVPAVMCAILLSVLSLLSKSPEANKEATPESVQSFLQREDTSPRDGLEGRSASLFDNSTVRFSR